MSDYAATQSFYGRWARLYDVIATAPGVTSWRAAAVDALDLAPGDTVVEFGCGTGANFPFLRDAVGDRGRVIGLDITPGMLARARERATAAGWQNVALVRGDARRPAIDGPVDAVLGAFVVGMFPDPGAVVTDWLSLLDADGSMALLNATRSPRRLAAPLNLAFRAFVRLSTPGGGDGGGGGDGPGPRASPSPTAILEGRIDAATRALADGTATGGHRRLAGGFVSLRWGHRPA